MHRRSLARYVQLGCFDEPVLGRYLGWMAAPAGHRWFVRFFQDYVLAEPRGVTERLTAIRVPVAVIWGDRDPFCPAWIAAELARRIPAAQLDWIRGADHYVMEERPPEVLAALGRWLAR